MYQTNLEVGKGCVYLPPYQSLKNFDLPIFTFGSVVYIFQIVAYNTFLVNNIICHEIVYTFYNRISTTRR